MKIISMVLWTIFSSAMNSIAGIQISGWAYRIEANGNSKSAIENEIEKMDLVSILGPGFNLKVSQALIEVTEIGGPAEKGVVEKRQVAFDCKLVADHEIESMEEMLIGNYITLRFNGFSQFGSVHILKCWFESGIEEDPYDIQNLPKEKFEVFKLPDWLFCFFNEEYAPVERKLHYRLFKDHDLYWILKENGSNCEFLFGIDARHFDTAGFSDAFDGERKKIGKERISRGDAETISKRMKDGWDISWLSPFGVPLPGS